MSPISWQHTHLAVVTILNQCVDSLFPCSFGHCERFPTTKSEATLTLLSWTRCCMDHQGHQHWGTCFTRWLSPVLSVGKEEDAGVDFSLWPWKYKLLMSSDLRNRCWGEEPRAEAGCTCCWCWVWTGLPHSRRFPSVLCIPRSSK